MPGAGLSRPGDRTLGRLDECCSEFDGGIARFNAVGLRRLVRARQLRRRGEPGNHALAGEDHQSLDDLFTHDGGVWLPSVGQAEVLERPVLSFDEVPLDGSQSSVLRGQQKPLAKSEWVSNGFGGQTLGAIGDCGCYRRWGRRGGFGDVF
jgi:hypothetical protein